MTSSIITFPLPAAVSASRAAARLGEFIASAITRLSHTAPLKTRRYSSREKERVRALAHSYEQADPRFAADIYAAVDRYEILNGG